MSKFPAAATAAVLAMAATALLSTPGEARPGPDTDGNGAVTRAEARAAASSRWTRLDANRDGVVDQADRSARQAQRFAALDRDGNGQVTFPELDAAREARRGERFARLDSDRSGGLSAAEFAARRGNRQRGDGLRAGGDDGQHMAGRRHGRPGPGMSGRGLGKAADTDGNGAISRAEFDTAVELRFATADADKDGSVSREERRAARQAMRAQWRAAKPPAGN